jgi:hypothetical protein
MGRPKIRKRNRLKYRRRYSNSHEPKAIDRLRHKIRLVYVYHTRLYVEKKIPETGIAMYVPVLYRTTIRYDQPPTQFSSYM